MSARRFFLSFALLLFVPRFPLAGNGKKTRPGNSTQLEHMP